MLALDRCELKGKENRKQKLYIRAQAKGPFFISREEIMTGCTPRPNPFQKWQSPIQCSRISRPVAAWGDGISVGKVCNTYSDSQDTSAVTEHLGSCCSSLPVISQAHIVFPRGVSIGKMPEVIYTFYSCDFRRSCT